MAKYPWRQWGLMVIFGGIMVMMLGFWFAADRDMQQRRLALGVIQPLHSNTLTDEVLVQWLSEHQIRERLMKVSWDHAILSIDIEGIQADEAKDDIGQFIQFAFGEVHNVRQILIRVFNKKSPQNILMMTAESRSSDWDQSELSGVLSSELVDNPFYYSKIRVSLTRTGQRWITNPSNS